jgi:hypothetical protein
MFGKGDEHSSLLDRRHRKPLAKITVRSADGRELGVDDVELSMPEVKGKTKRRHHA